MNFELGVGNYELGLLKNRLSPSRKGAKSLFSSHFVTLRLAKPSLWELCESYF